MLFLLAAVERRIGKAWDTVIVPKLEASMFEAWSDHLSKPMLERMLVDDLDGGKDAGLGGLLVKDKEYVRATRIGARVLPNHGDEPLDVEALGKAHADRVRPYADAVAVTIAGLLADAVTDIRLANPSDEIGAKVGIAEAIAGRRYSVTRYAGPQWGAGMAGFANQAKSGVRFLWVLDDGAEHCGDCPDLAGESEAAGGWLVSEIPTYPGMGDTACLDRCRCSLTTDPASWMAAYGK